MKKLAQCAVTLLSLSPLPALASDERVILVSGECRREVMTDRGSIQLTAEARDPDLRRANARANDLYVRLKGEVERLKLADVELRTVESSLEEVREWHRDKAVSKGFRARRGLRVATSAIDRIGEVISIAAKLDIREIASLQTYVSEAKSESERMACLETAVGNAREKANRLAAASGASVGRVLSVVEGGASGQRPVFAAEAKMAKMAHDDPGFGGGASASVSGGVENVRVNVSVGFQLR